VKVPKKKNQREDSMEEKLAKEIDRKNAAMNSGIDFDLFPEKEEKPPEVDTYTYVRSQRAVTFRVQETMEQDVAETKN